MANRATPLTNIETLTGNIAASTYFDNNIGPAFTALNDASLGYVNGLLTDTGSANAYVLSSAFGTPSGYNEGMTIFFNPLNGNTGNSTVSVSPLAATSLLNPAGLALSGGEVAPGRIAGAVLHGGSGFWLIPPCPLVYTASSPGAVTLNCKGYSAVTVLIFYQTSTATGLTLQNLASGVIVNVTFSSSFGSAVNYSIACATGTINNYIINASIPTTLAGAAVIGMQNGTTINAFGLNANSTITLTGITVANSLYFNL